MAFVVANDAQGPYSAEGLLPRAYDLKQTRGILTLTARMNTTQKFRSITPYISILTSSNALQCANHINASMLSWGASF